MEFQLLGPVEATLEGRRVELGATKQRALLAMLALDANAAVPVDRLVDGLWGDDPPATAAKMVQLYVSRLRRVFVDAGAEIVTHGRGYELRADASSIDAVRFERLVERAGNGNGGGDAHEALALWRGPPLADVADEPFAAAQIRRLEALRLRAAELAVEADLAAGREQAALTGVERLLEEHPLNERLHALRILALYRCGRQSDALAGYREARELLVEEIGIEPGPELRRLHDAVLSQDPELSAPRAKRVAEPSPMPARAPVRRRRVVGVAALVLVASAAVFAFERWTWPDSLPGVDADMVGLIDAGSGAITAQYPVGHDPAALATGAGSTWALNTADNTVSRIETDNGRVTVIPVGDELGGLTFAAGSLWVTDRRRRVVAQVSPATNRVVQTIPVGNSPGAIAAGFGSLWVASEVDETVTRIDLSRAAVSDTIALATSPTALATGAGAVWVASEEGRTVFRIDPGPSAVTATIGVGSGPVGVAATGRAVWVANRQDATISRIDPATDGVGESIRVGGEPSAIAADRDGVWVADSDGTVLKLDPATGRRVQTVDVGSSPGGLALAGGSLWTTAAAPPSSHRGGTLRVEVPAYEYPRLEPVDYDVNVNELLALAYDGLLMYPRVGSGTFGTLTGALATGVPAPSPDGLSYVFKLRPGLRYSDGAAVKPEDFRVSLEHFLPRRPSGWAGFDRIVGAAECVPDGPACDLSRGIVTDDAARTITIHLTRPDPELLHWLAFPFGFVAPAGHPFGGAEHPPGTGPYRIVSFDPKRGARLERNPHFRVWARGPRPDGLADAIDVRAHEEVDAAVAAVAAGPGDVVTVADPFGSRVDPSRLAGIAAHTAGRFHTNADAEMDYLFLNARTAPFDDVRVRRALNYATDRRAIEKLAGGADLAPLACQHLPAGFPGYVPACSFTVDPGPGGWSAPNLEQARWLIDASGTRGMRVDVWVNAQKAPIARYFVSLLRTLGYRSSLHVSPDYGAYRTQLARTRTPQAGIDGWTADVALPAHFLSPFACSGYEPTSPDNPNLGGFCDRALERAIAAARDRPGAATWRALSQRLEASAPTVPLVNRRTVTLVSERVGNFQHHPLWGTLLEQLSVR